MITNDTIPVCEELMEGTEASSKGIIVSNLDLKEGYYRTSASSQVVIECYYKEACTGGSTAEKYCADGYEGPCKFDVLNTVTVVYIPKQIIGIAAAPS